MTVVGIMPSFSSRQGRRWRVMRDRSEKVPRTAPLQNAIRVQCGSRISCAISRYYCPFRELLVTVADTSFRGERRRLKTGCHSLVTECNSMPCEWSKAVDGASLEIAFPPPASFWHSSSYTIRITQSHSYGAPSPPMAGARV